MYPVWFVLFRCRWMKEATSCAYIMEHQMVQYHFLNHARRVREWFLELLCLFAWSRTMSYHKDIHLKLVTLLLSYKIVFFIPFTGWLKNLVAYFYGPPCTRDVWPWPWGQKFCPWPWHCNTRYPGSCCVICDFLQQLSLNFLQKTINHVVMVHMPRNEIRWQKDISRIILI